MHLSTSEIRGGDLLLCFYACAKKQSWFSNDAAYIVKEVGRYMPSNRNKYKLLKLLAINFHEIYMLRFIWRIIYTWNKVRKHPFFHNYFTLNFITYVRIYSKNAYPAMSITTFSCLYVDFIHTLYFLKIPCV